VLSDHERETLREIQRHLIVEDPDFEKPFRAFEVPPPPARYRWIHTTLVAVTAVLAPVMLLAGSLGGAIAFAIVAGTFWWIRHLEYGTGRRHTPPA
jgi:hypothetical protein